MYLKSNSYGMGRPDVRLGREVDSFAFVLLASAFLFSLLSIQLTAWIYYLYGKYITFYHYLFGVYFFFALGFIVQRRKLIDAYDKRIVLLAAYLIVIPSIFGSSNPTDVLVGVKNIAMPFILYFILKMVLPSQTSVYRFLRVVVFSSIISSFYCIFESINRTYEIWPSFWKFALYFIMDHRPGLTGYVETLVDLRTLIVRPLGIFLDIFSQGFLIIAGFLIVQICWSRVFSSILLLRVMISILLLGVAFSTAKTHIVILFILVLLLAIFAKRGNRIASSKGPITFTLVFIGMGLLFAAFFGRRIVEYLHLTGTGTFRIILDDMTGFIYHDMPALFALNPLRIVFGYGFGNDLAFLGEIHGFGRQIAVIGLFGLYFFWSVFFRVFRECYRAVRVSGCDNSDSDSRLFELGFFMTLALWLSFWHYSPLNVSNDFLAALILLIGNFAYRHNRGI